MISSTAHTTNTITTTQIKPNEQTSSSTVFTVNFNEFRHQQKNSDNLQDAFLKFKKAKEDGIKLALKNKEKCRSLRAHPDRMFYLRMKFLKQANKYIGVPYAKKYFSPDSNEYNSPLFLDCCGLVRRVMRDLENDFGFRIGPGNQAYMFDTLPKTINNINDVKPGDLVFISGIYYNSKMKKQRHNMTHVEIMLGDGEKTIGARWNNGKIQIFDSYKFTSTSFHSETYYFKSIDTWLLGICRSFCPQHSWNYRIYKPSPKSIFYVQSLPSKKKKNKKVKKKKTKKKKLLVEEASIQENEVINANEQEEIDNKSEGTFDGINNQDELEEYCDIQENNGQINDDYNDDDEDEACEEQLDFEQSDENLIDNLVKLSI